MRKTLLFLSLMLAAAAQVQNYKPVTEEMLENPSPDDWLMYSRTYDAQRFSPLKQINRSRTSASSAWRGRAAWAPAQTETIPIVHNGVMYVVEPGAIVQALDAATGDLLWEYKRKVPANAAEHGAHQSRSPSIRTSFFTPRPTASSSAWTPAPASSAGRPSTGDGAAIPPAPSSWKAKSSPAAPARQDARHLLHRRAGRAHRQGSLEFYTTSRRPASPAMKPGAARSQGHQPRVHLGTARHLRSRPQNALLGHRQSHAEHAPAAPWRQSRRHLANRARRSLQQLHRRARSRHRQARLVLPASARRRLGLDYTHERTLVRTQSSIPIRST